MSEQYVDGTFGRYGNAQLFNNDKGYSVIFFLATPDFKGSVSLTLNGLNRKQARKLMKFDFDHPKLSVKTLLFELKEHFAE